MYIWFADNSSSKLDELKSELLQFVAQFLEGYLWQRQPFSVHTFPGPKTPPWLQKSRTAPPSNDFEALFTAAATFAAPPPASSSFLWGSVNFGDNIEDEWFITWLLLEITRTFPVTARIWDNDGEFILIEAAYVLPRWLKPEIAVNRVWLHNGTIHLVPLPSSKHSTTAAAAAYPAEWGKAELTPVHGLHAVQNFSSITTASGKPIYDALASRIDEYPTKAKELMHSTVALLPARLAHVISRLPQSVAAAVEIFYTRDPSDHRAASKMAYFPPENLVKAYVRFNRCLYAQIALQNFAPVKNWPDIPMSSHPDYPAAILGVKVSAGYEMLLSFFDKGSDYSNAQYKSVVPAVKEILTEEIDLESLKTASANCPPAESEAWLQQGPQIMENELKKHEEEAKLHEERKLQQQNRRKNDTNGPQNNNSNEDDDEFQDFDPSQLSSKMKEFMEASANWEGAEVPGEGSGNAVDFDETKFIAELQRIFGGGVGKKKKKNENSRSGGGGGADDNSDNSSSEEGSSFYSDGSEDEDGDVENLASRHAQYTWEAATATDSDDDGGGGGSGNEDDALDFRESYDAVLAQQLRDTSLAHTFTTAEAVLNAEEGKRDQSGGGTTAGEEHSDKDNEEDISLLPVDVDANLVASLLASYQEQAGLPGPASNLAGLLGINLPDNVPDDNSSK